MDVNAGGLVTTIRGVRDISSCDLFVRIIGYSLTLLITCKQNYRLIACKTALLPYTRITN